MGGRRPWWVVWWIAGVVLPGVSGEESGGRHELSTGREREMAGARSAGVEAGPAGWVSEVFHERTQEVLGGLGEALAAGEGIGDFVSADGRLVDPGELVRVYASGGVVVSRGVGGVAEETGLGEGLLAACEFLRRGSGEVRFKQFRVEPGGGGVGVTEALFSGTVDEGRRSVSRRAVWRMWWDAELRLTRVEVSGVEEVVREGVEPLFLERSQAVLGAAGRYANTTDWGANRMSERLLSESGRLLVGIALGDANGDGRDDVFCPQGAGMANLYYLSTAGGGFEETGKQAGLDWLDPTSAGLWVDFDNDGDADLAVATSGLLVVMENEGQGRWFRRRASFQQQDSSALCAADYDGDGLVDLFVANYLSDVAGTAVANPAAIYDAVGGGTNRLYRNGGGFEFLEVTGEVGLLAGATRLTLAAGWEDFDDDGDQDLYVANDFGRNCLYRNDGGRFEEIAVQAGADDPSTGMSVSWADVDGDGRMDVSVANMYSAAGNRVVPQGVFRERLPEGLDVGRVGALARGNALLMNRGGRFEERGGESGMGNTQWTWGLLLADLDNSKHPDVIAVNGFLTGPEEDDL